MDTIDKINHLLVDKGLTGAELCRRAGLSSGTYSMWNTKQRGISNTNLHKVAQVLGVSPSSLLPDPEEVPQTDETAEMLQYIKDNPGMRILFSKAKNATPEQLLAIAQMIDTFRNNS